MGIFSRVVKEIKKGSWYDQKWVTARSVYGDIIAALLYEIPGAQPTDLLVGNQEIAAFTMLDHNNNSFYGYSSPGLLEKKVQLTKAAVNVLYKDGKAGVIDLVRWSKRLKDLKQERGIR